MQVLRTILSGRRHWRIFLSAFAGVVFVLSLLLVMNQAFQASLIATLSSMNEEYGERADAIAGTMTDLIQTSAMQIYYSPSIKPLRSHASLTNAQRTAGLRLLGTSISSSEFIVSAVIYNPQRDRIYSSDGYAISLVDDYADESAKELLLNPPDIPHTTPIKRTSKSASYYSFLFYEKDNPQSGVLLLDVNAAWYERQLMGISPGVNSAFFTADGEYIAAGSDTLAAEAAAVLPQIQAEEAAADRGYLRVGDSTVWFYHRLSDSGWYSLCRFEMSEIAPGMLNVRRLVFLLLSVTSVLFVIWAFYIVIRFYLPLNKIRQALRRAGRTEQETVSVSDEVDRLLEEQHEDDMGRQMRQCLLGNAPAGLAFPVRLLLCSCPDPEEMRALFADHPGVLAAASTYGSAVLIPVPDPADPLLQEFCIGHFSNSPYFCTFGASCARAEDIPASFARQAELWQLRFLYAGQHVLSETMADRFAAASAFQTKDAAALYSLLRAGELNAARESWHTIFAAIRCDHYNDFRFAVRYIEKGLHLLGQELECPSLPPLTPLDKLTDIQTLHTELDAQFVALCAASDGRRKVRLHALEAQIRSRISTGYTDENFSPQQIADEMGMNVSYLARLFQQSAGVSISDALLETRMQAAKVRLCRSSEPIESIARSIGFANPKYFYVLFKKNAGVTPRQYRLEHGGS